MTLRPRSALFPYTTLFRSPLGAPMKHESAVSGLAFSPDGARAVTASSKGSARLWSVPDGIPMGAPMRHAGSVNSVQFSPDGRSEEHTSELQSLTNLVCRLL